MADPRAPLAPAGAGALELHGIRAGQSGLTGVVLPVFDGKNWYTYRIYVEAEMISAGLWSVLNGEERRRAEAGVEQREWDRKSWFCRTALLRSITSDVLPFVSEITTGPEMWHALQNTFASDSEIRRQVLFDSVNDFPKLQGNNMSSHIAKFDMAINQYVSACVGAGVDAGYFGDIQKKSILTRTLPPEWTLFVQGLRSLQPNYAEFCRALKSEAETRENNQETEHKALHTYGEPSKPASKPHDRKRPKCNYCGKLGHVITECRKIEKQDF